METTTHSKSVSVEIQTNYQKIHPILHWLDEFLRRSMDIGVSFFGLLLLSPIFLMIAAAIKHDSTGPIFFRGRRMGKGCKEFKILKFRTMYESEYSHNGAKITARDDLRITPIGKWLRDTKVNELPQLWNVLVGEMSLVGPRPEDPDIVITWPENYRDILLAVRPGVTSPATITYRDEETLLSADNYMQDYLKEILPTKMRLDKLYVRHRNVITDLDVIFWTAIALLPNLRHKNVPQQYLFWGPISRIFRRYLSWFIIDMVIALLSFAVAGGLWRLSGPFDIGLGGNFLYALGISLLFSFMNRLLGLNKVEWSRAPAKYSFNLGISITLATLVVVALDGLNPFTPPLPLPVILIGAILSLAGFITVRYRERLITSTATRWLRLRGGMHIIGERVLIVGCGENSGLANWLFEKSSIGAAVSVVGIVDDDPRKQGLLIDDYKVLGTTSEIPNLVEALDIGIIFFTIDNIEPAQRSRILTLCRQTGAKLVILPDILEIFRKELKIVHTPENGAAAISLKSDPEQFLDEIQSLLVEYKVEAAQARLTEFRQLYLPKNR